MAERKPSKRTGGKTGGKKSPERSTGKSSGQSGKRPGRELLEALLIALLFLKFANTFVLQTFYIPSGSMEETLLIGDHLFVNRFVYGPPGSEAVADLLPHREIQRGDIVIFRSPDDPDIDLVKRCIALPGDRVEIRAKQLHIDGERVDDDVYAVHKDPRVVGGHGRRGQVERGRDNFGPFTVPEDSYFCLGDNRDRSYDSRYWGAVPRDLVKGRAFMIYWSYDYQDDPPDGHSRGAFSGLRRFGRTLVGFPAHTRWGRSFQIIR